MNYDSKILKSATVSYHKFMLGGGVNIQKANKALKKYSIKEEDHNEFLIMYKEGLDYGMAALIGKPIEEQSQYHKSEVFKTAYSLGAKELRNELLGVNSFKKISFIIVIVLIALILFLILKV